MKTTYQVCGKIDAANKKATIFSYLPDLNIQFRFIRLFNISTSTHYGIVGILVNEGKNIDLSDFPAQLSPLPGNVDLKNLDYTYSKFGFNELTDDDQIYFHCFHDDEFNTVNPGYEEFIELDKIQDILPLKVKHSDHPITEIHFDKVVSRTEAEKDPTAEPKKGNGGILTYTGNCIP